MVGLSTCCIHVPAPAYYMNAGSYYINAPAYIRYAPLCYTIAPRYYTFAPTKNTDSPAYYMNGGSYYTNAPTYIKNAPLYYMVAPTKNTIAAACYMILLLYSIKKAPLSALVVVFTAERNCADKTGIYFFRCLRCPARGSCLKGIAATCLY